MRSYTSTPGTFGPLFRAGSKTANSYRGSFMLANVIGANLPLSTDSVCASMFNEPSCSDESTIIRSCVIYRRGESPTSAVYIARRKLLQTTTEVPRSTGKVALAVRKYIDNSLTSFLPLLLRGESIITDSNGLRKNK
uniref:Non-specific lipid-transfer protein P3 n=1 Tax=Lygus hesperus TaxID=30085 RepID=A0A0A9XFW6_LYGHE